MNEVFLHCTAETLGDFLASAMQGISASDVAFLAAGSKPEGLVRDQLALHIHRDTELIAAREWSQRIDLAVLSENGPEVLIELKAWTHFNALNEKKLVGISRKHGLFGAFAADAEKLVKCGAEFQKKYGYQPKLFAINVFFGVAVVDVNVPFSGVVKYANEHKKALQIFEDLDALCDAGIKKATDFFATHGEISAHRLLSGTCWGLDARLDALVVEVRPDWR